MTPSRFLRIVLALWGDHWQQPCLAFLAEHGYQYSRKSLWAWKTGNRRVPEHVEELLEGERKAKSAKSTPVVIRRLGQHRLICSEF